MSSPIPLDEAQANWRVDDSLALHTADESNGLNDHAGPGTDLDYKRGGSTEGPPPSSGMKGDGVFREKQVKVLRSFLSIACQCAQSQRRSSRTRSPWWFGYRSLTSSC